MTEVFMATRDGNFLDPTIWNNRPTNYEGGVFDANGFKIKLPSVTKCQTLKNASGGFFYFDPDEKNCNLFASVEPTFSPLVVAGCKPEKIVQEIVQDKFKLSN